jgi:hypothetical protein
MKKTLALGMGVALAVGGGVWLLSTAGLSLREAERAGGGVAEAALSEPPWVRAVLLTDRSRGAYLSVPQQAESAYFREREEAFGFRIKEIGEEKVLFERGGQSYAVALRSPERSADRAPSARTSAGGAPSAPGPRGSEAPQPAASAPSFQSPGDHPATFREVMEFHRSRREAFSELKEGEVVVRKKGAPPEVRPVSPPAP